MALPAVVMSILFLLGFVPAGKSEGHFAGLAQATMNERTTLLMSGQASAPISISGSGSALVAPLLTSWATEFRADSAEASVGSISYTSTSSQQANDAMIQQKVDFAFTALDFTESAYASNPDLQLVPTVVVPLVFGFSLAGGVSLTLPHDVLPEIWAGTLTFWNDSRLQRANPQVLLPNAQIVVLVRQGDTGATQILSEAFSAFSSVWKTKFGIFSNASQFAASTANLVPCKDDNAVAAMISSTPYTIGYMSLNAALARSVSFATVINSQNQTTYPTEHPVMQDLQAATLSSRLTVSVVNLPGLLTYPILSMMYAAVRMNSTADCAKVDLLAKFLRWILIDSRADRVALDLGYIPLPSKVTASALERLLSMTCAQRQRQQRGEVMNLVAGGATQAGPLFDAWGFQYMNDHPNILSEFRQVGSGAGVSQVKSRGFDFSVTDNDLVDADYQQAPALQMIPMLISGAVLAFNLPELASSNLALVWSREVLCLVFNGTIRYWNDPKIRRLNPFVYFPKQRIIIVAVSRANAAAVMFRSALMSFDPTWGNKSNTSSSQPWSPNIRSSMIFPDSHEAVGTTVEATPYALGVMPFQTAQQAKLNLISIINRAGNAILPTSSSLAISAEGVNFDGRFSSVLMDGNGPDSYPIVGFSNYVILSAIEGVDPSVCEKAKAVVDFLRWTMENTTAFLLAWANGYVPAFSSPHPRVLATLKTFRCNSVLLIPPPVKIPEPELNVIPIVVPVAIGALAIGSVAAAVLWRIRKRLNWMNRKLMDVKVAVELSDAIATLDLDKMAFLETVERPTTTQQSCQRILRTLKHVKKFVPQAVLCDLLRQVHGDDGEDEDDDDDENDDNDSEGAGADAAAEWVGRATQKPDREKGRSFDGRSSEGPRRSWDQRGRHKAVPSDSQEELILADVVSVPRGSMDECSAEEGSSTARKSDGASTSKAPHRASLDSRGTATTTTTATTNPVLVVKSPTTTFAPRRPTFASNVSGEPTLSNRLSSFRSAGSCHPTAKNKSAFSHHQRHGSRSSRASRQSAHSSVAHPAVRVQKKAITVMLVRIMNFNEIFDRDNATAILVFNQFLSRVYPVVSVRSGTIAQYDCESICIHWNASKRSTMARLQACEVAVKIYEVAKEFSFIVQVGISCGQAMYSTIGCEGVSCLSVLGQLWNRVELFQQLCASHGTAIVIDEEVKQQGPTGACFLLNVVQCTNERLLLPSRTRVFQIVPEAVVDTAQLDDEWLYAFKESGTQATDKAKAWAATIEAFYKGDFNKANDLIGKSLAANSIPTPMVGFAQNLLSIGSGGHEGITQIEKDDPRDGRSVTVKPPNHPHGGGLPACFIGVGPFLSLAPREDPLAVLPSQVKEDLEQLES